MAENRWRKKYDIVYDDRPLLKEIWYRAKEHPEWFVYILELADHVMKVEKVIVNDNSFLCDVTEKQNKYYVVWNLWIYVLIQTFQYLYLNYWPESNKINELLVNMEFRKRSLDNICRNKTDEKTAETHSLAEEYYRYNRLLQIRTGIIEELKKQFISPKKDVKIKDEDFWEDFFVADIRFGQNSKKDLFKKFNSGVSECKRETFKLRLEKCLKFIKKFNMLSGRRLNPNDARVLRAVYRAIYINPIEVDRNKSEKIMKEIMDLPNIRDEKILGKYYALSEHITKELIREFDKTGDLFKIKRVFLTKLYHISLNILYTDYPMIGCTDYELTVKLERLGFVMKNILDLLYSELL